MKDSDLTPRKVAWSVLAAVLAVLLMTVVSAKAGIIALAVFALAGAAARVVTPLRSAFVVRRRGVDVIVLTFFGSALLYLGLTTSLG